MVDGRGGSLVRVTGGGRLVKSSAGRSVGFTGR
jgi:hypothetical protein